MKNKIGDCTITQNTFLSISVCTVYIHFLEMINVLVKIRDPGHSSGLQQCKPELISTMQSQEPEFSFYSLFQLYSYQLYHFDTQ
jgi:hypothetical protein